MSCLVGNPESRFSHNRQWVQHRMVIVVNFFVFLIFFFFFALLLLYVTWCTMLRLYFTFLNC